VNGTPGDNGMEYIERTLLDDIPDEIVVEADATFREIAVQYDDPVTRRIQMGIAQAKKTLDIE
jgi:hypothetical protein